MKRAIVPAGIIILVLVAGYYSYKRAADCFWSTGAIHSPRITEIQKGQPIVLRFEMLRISGPGCFKGRSSESYRDVSCGYRVGESTQWEAADLSVVTDSETTYVVECAIPPVSTDTPAEAKLDYYFQYSAWGRSPERKSASLTIN